MDQVFGALGAAINQVSVDSYKLQLIEAIENNDENAVFAAITQLRGAQQDFNYVIEGISPLSAAVRVGNVYLVSLFDSYGARPDYHNTDIMEAIAEGNSKGFDYMAFASGVFTPTLARQSFDGQVQTIEGGPAISDGDALMDDFALPPASSSGEKRNHQQVDVSQHSLDMYDNNQRPGKRSRLPAFGR